ncbi:hypothetical protein ACLB1T_02950 [Escherichia coli]
MSVFATVGSGPGGNGQNVARMFIRLKDWSERAVRPAPRLPLSSVQQRRLTRLRSSRYRQQPASN